MSAEVPCDCDCEIKMIMLETRLIARMKAARASDSVADNALEAQIDAAYEFMASAKTDEASREYLSEMSRLILQRSQSQQLKLELERRMRARA